MERNYTLNIGDVVLIKEAHWGFVNEDLDKYVRVVGYSKYVSDNSPAVLTVPYDCELLSTPNKDSQWKCGYESFGDNPLVLLNTKDELTKGNFDSSLESRKNDKNQMELVDTGFPNALMVLGEVMTWAAKNKGYLPNDWKDIPNPSMSLLGAASRHRNKRLKGEEFDDESGLPHLAHEVFNVLAQLELLMMGKLND
jgi:hypothetical protein